MEFVFMDFRTIVADIDFIFASQWTLLRERSSR